MPETPSITQSMTTAEEPAGEAGVVQRRILLSFSATVVLALILFGTYVARKTGVVVAAETKPVRKILAVSDPPAPLPDSASPYQAPIAAMNPVSPRSSLTLDIVATQDAWIEVSTDGQRICAKLLRANEIISFVASERIRMMTGNTKGIEVRFNGKPVEAIDAKGSVRTIEFTVEGSRDLNSFQSVSKS